MGAYDIRIEFALQLPFIRHRSAAGKKSFHDVTKRRDAKRGEMRE
jgi:hypothetical protein